jgi:8-oxo-dGTP diphosphatase
MISALLPVAAGILRREGRILVCRRRSGGPFGLKWEFPGGKIQEGESPTEALVRELEEELCIEAEPGPEVERIEHHYAEGRPVRLHFFEVTSFRGEPRNNNFDEIRWSEPSGCLDLDWLEADRPLVQRLARSGGRALPARVGPDTMKASNSPDGTV